jgi:hypothetical protein
MIRTPNWLQIGVIMLVLATSAWSFVFWGPRMGWLFAIAGVAFLISFLLRQGVGDDYGRT